MFYTNLYIVLTLSSLILLIAVWRARPIAALKWVTARIDTKPKRRQR